MGIRHGEHVLRRLAHIGGFALRRQGDDIRPARFDLDDVRERLFKQRLIGTERNDEGTVLDKGYGAVLEFARSVGLGVNIGYLLELEAALKAEGVIKVAPDEEDGIVVKVCLLYTSPSPRD